MALSLRVFLTFVAQNAIMTVQSIVSFIRQGGHAVTAEFGHGILDPDETFHENQYDWQKSNPLTIPTAVPA
jgi:hypothetical protein